MHRAMSVMVGLMVMVGLLIGPPPAEATPNSCSLNGTYILSGLGEAAGFLEVVGLLSFTPNGACTSGTLGGSVTIRHQGVAPTPFTPSGTYSVDSSGNVTASVPGVIDLVGIISLVTSSDTVANSIHMVVTFAGPQVLALTATREAPTPGLQVLDRNTSDVLFGSTTTETTVYSFTVPGGTLGINKKLRGELWANYGNTSGGPVNLTIRLKYGAGGVARTTVSIASGSSNGNLHIEFFVANMKELTIVQRLGFHAIVDDTCCSGTNQFSPVAAGVATTDSTTDQNLVITLQWAGATGTFMDKQFAILELL